MYDIAAGWTGSITLPSRGVSFSSVGGGSGYGGTTGAGYYPQGVDSCFSTLEEIPGGFRYTKRERAWVVGTGGALPSLGPLRVQMLTKVYEWQRGMGRQAIDGLARRSSVKVVKR